MAVEGVAASLSASVQPAASGQGTGQEQISDLMRLEQDVRKMKSNYRDSAKKDGFSQSEIDIKVKQYDRLIAKIEQEIRQIKQSEARRAAEKPATAGRGSSRRNDQTAMSIAALKASYRVLIQPSATLAQPDIPAGEAAPAKNLDGLA